MRYYRTAPPPPLPTAISVSYAQPPYIMYGQPQNKMMIMPANIANPNHPLQQVSAYKQFTKMGACVWNESKRSKQKFSQTGF